MSFRLIGSEAMAVVDPTAVAVEWRADVFRKPSRTRVTATGRVVRREILMEDNEELDDLPQTPKVTDSLPHDGYSRFQIAAPDSAGRLQSKILAG